MTLTPESATELGERLRELRLLKGFSQRELARRADMTNGSLSMIEKGRVSPSVQSLQRILAALGTSLPQFFQSSLRPAVEVWPADTLPAYGIGGGVGHTLHWSADPIRLKSLSHMAIEPGLSCQSFPVSGDDFVSGMVASGRVHLIVADQHHALAVGDAFRFAANRSHIFHNDTDERASLVYFNFVSWAVTHPLSAV